MAVNQPNPILAAAAQRPGIRTLDINPLKYLEKIQTFDGRKEDLCTFCTNVDDIIPTLMLYNEQAQRMCINIIKSKLMGKARRAMEIHPHLNNWSEIKAMLETNFGGFQTADQLYEELRAAQYRGSTINFHNYILQKLAILNQKSRQEGNMQDVERNIQTALKVFTTRLPVHMRTVLCSLKPRTMEEAMHELAQSGFLNEEKGTDKREERNNWQPKTNYNKQQDNKQHNNRQQNNRWQQNNRCLQNNDQHNNWQPKFYTPTTQQQPEPMDVSTIQTRRQNHHGQQSREAECNCKCLNFDYKNYVGQNRQNYEPHEPGNFPVMASQPKDPGDSDSHISYLEENQGPCDY